MHIPRLFLNELLQRYGHLKCSKWPLAAILDLAQLEVLPTLEPNMKWIE